jgi:hypothetical protein
MYLTPINGSWYACEYWHVQYQVVPDRRSQHPSRNRKFTVIIFFSTLYSPLINLAITLDL